MSKNVWITIGFVAIAIAAFYAGKTGFWGLSKPKLASVPLGTAVIMPNPGQPALNGQAPIMG